MAIKTIIEINQDFIHTLIERPEIMQEVFEELSKGNWEKKHYLGVSVLGRRHHADPLILKLGPVDDNCKSELVVKD